MIPTMILYGTGDGFGEGIDSNLYFTTPTIGHLGALESHCHTHLINFDNSNEKSSMSMHLDCHIGHVEFLSYTGMIPKDFEVRHFCGDPNEKEMV